MEWRISSIESRTMDVSFTVIHGLAPCTLKCLRNVELSAPSVTLAQGILTAMTVSGWMVVDGAMKGPTAWRASQVDLTRSTTVGLKIGPMGTIITHIAPKHLMVL